MVLALLKAIRYDGETMPKKIKIANGGGLFLSKTISLYAGYTSVNQLRQMFDSIPQMHPLTQGEFYGWWSRDCWGDNMDGVEPQIGLWVELKWSETPLRIADAAGPIPANIAILEKRLKK